jgi:hypothetical protein
MKRRRVVTGNSLPIDAGLTRACEPNSSNRRQAELSVVTLNFTSLLIPKLRKIRDPKLIMQCCWLEVNWYF